MGNPDTALGLRERKKLRTEGELRDVALRLVAERGFDHVTTDDIAAAAEVSKTTFYRYFESKEDALLGSSSEKLDRLREMLAAQPTDEPALVSVRNALMAFFDEHEHDREVTLARGRIIRATPSLTARSLEQQADCEAVLVDFIASRLEDDGELELRSRIVAAIVMATMRATVDYWRDTDGRDDLPVLMDTALSMLAEKRAALASPA